MPCVSSVAKAKHNVNIERYCNWTSCADPMPQMSSKQFCECINENDDLHKDTLNCLLNDVKEKQLRYNPHIDWAQVGEDIDNGEIVTDVTLNRDGSILAVSYAENPAKVFKYNNITNSWVQLGSDIVFPTTVIRSHLNSTGDVLVLGNSNQDIVRVFQFDGSDWDN